MLHNTRLLLPVEKVVYALFPLVKRPFCPVAYPSHTLAGSPGISRTSRGTA